MHQLTTFQIVVLGIFAAFILVGVGVFAVSGGLGGKQEVGSVVVWGTVDSDVMQRVFGELRPNDKTFQSVSYTQKKTETYDSELINAMASGVGPDLIMLSQDELLAFADKVLTIPYGAVSEASFIGSYVDEGQLFLTQDGSLALPFIIDPLVMYWNRDLLAGAGVASPPKYWNEFFDLAPKVTSLDAGATVKKSAVALGQWENIFHAKDILATLFIQAGDKIVARGEDGVPGSVFGRRPTNVQSTPAESALRFYTEFGNPSKTSYSWNRSLPRSDNAFVAGDVAVYFGYASEYRGLLERNPNLHFSAAVLPQIEGGGVKATYGRLVGLAIPRSSSNPAGALTVARHLTDKTGIGTLAPLTGLPPVRRDVVLDTANNAAMTVFVQSALLARGWLDPSSSATNRIFQTMVESVISGKNEPAAAVAAAAAELEALLPY